ncbi:MAG: glycosyltransferase [Thermoclostridium sp.]|nr:glycosyltransferase [Thermoclostridium sp.]
MTASSNETNPKVSVVMCVWNGEKHLSEAINSILGQTFKDFEFIIVNDGSTDETEKVLSLFASQDSRIRILDNTLNLGQSYSKNRGIAAARGEYIAMMDADDWCDPHRFDLQVDFLDMNPEISVLGTDYLIFREDNSGSHLMETANLPGLLRWDFIFHCAICQASVMMRRCLFSQQGYRYLENLRTAADFELWTRILQTNKIANLNKTLYFYRWHSDNISVRKADDQKKNTNDVIRRQVNLYIGEEVSENLIEGIKWPKKIKDTSDARRVISLYLKLLDATESWDLDEGESSAIMKDFLNKLNTTAKAVHKHPLMLISGRFLSSFLKRYIQYRIPNRSIKH